MQTLDSGAIRPTRRRGGRSQKAHRDSDPQDAAARTASSPRRNAAAPQQVGAAALLQSNHAPPALAARYISRPRLVRRLREEREATTIVLAAPAGYGKSSLLAEWAESDSRPFAWLDLSREPDDPAQLRRALARALRWLLAGGEAGQVADHDQPAVGGEAQAPTLSELLALADVVAECGRGGVLVLDDVNRLCAVESLELLAELARGIAPPLMLALASRGEPPLRLGRLRAAHSLLELGPLELAMTSYEAYQVLEAVGVQLAEDALERLVDRTEGWPVALHLAALSLQAGVDAGTEDAQPAAGEHAIAEYVNEEILASLRADARGLLMRTAVLEQLSGELCDVLLDRRGTGQTLRELAAATGMLIPQNSAHTWYRCHSVLRDVLRSEMESREPGEIPPLHARASDWFAARGEIDRALDHAVAARDADRAGSLLWDHAPRLLSVNDAQVRSWLSAFTSDEIASCARLSLAAAYNHLAAGDLVTARHWALVGAESLEHAAHGAGSSSLLAGVCLIEAAAGSGGAEQVIASAERADGLVGDASPLRPMCCLLRGIALHLAGERERAHELLEQAVEGCAGTLPVVEALGLTQLALMDVEDGDWEQAEDRTDRALAGLTAHDLDAQPTAALTLAVSALVMSRRGVADGARRELTSATRLLESLGSYMPWYEVETRIVMARASTRLADVANARSLLSQASRWARRTRPLPCFVRWLDDAWGDIDEVSAAALSGPGSLTMAELRVLRFLPTHLSFREIGERLHVSGNTVKSQAHAVYAKLGAASRSEAVAHASALGLIDVQVI